MKLRLSSSSRLVLESIVSVASDCSRSGRLPNHYSSAIEQSLTEMVRDQMRRLMQSRAHDYQVTVLDQAVEQVFAQVGRALGDDGIRLDLGQYENQVRKTLKPVAAEMEKLGLQLIQSRDTGKLAPETIMPTETLRQFEFRELGLRGLTEGFLVGPIGDTFDVNLEQLPDGCSVCGDWFPYEIQYGDFVIVLDDDGTLYVSVENLPRSLAAEARTKLQEFARHVYG